MVVNTVRCKGHLATPNRISCSTWDGAILPNDREWAREFYTQLRVRTVDTAVDGLMDKSKDFIATCRVFSACRFDDTEKAVFAFILLLKCAPPELFNVSARNAALDKLFRDLHAYEKAKVNDYAVRVGELMLFLQEFEVRA
ncbi:hypothetical protein AAVH_14153 [Aphelenchoides avenae]|nr:hypothetical protein AAVH_14153 [Aphelenchus avenae]